MLKSRFSLLAFSLLASSLVSAQSQAPALPAQESVTLVVGRVVTADGVFHSPGIIRMAGGKITEVRGGSVPAGAGVISLPNSVAYPGFIDGQTTRGIKFPPVPAEATRPGVATAAPNTMWIANRKGITPEFVTKDNLDLTPDAGTYQAGICTSLLTPTRGSMRGQATLVNQLPGTATDRVIDPSFAACFSFRGGPGGGYPTNLLGVIALMRQVLIDAVSVRDGASLFTGTKPAWMASLEALQPVVKRQEPVIFEANLAREIDRAINLSQEFGFKLIIQGGRDAFAAVDQLGSAKIPVIFSAEPGTAPSLEESADTPLADRQPMAFRQERFDRWQEAARSPVALVGKAPFCFASDGNPENYLRGIRARIALGLDQQQALYAMTLGAAEIFGLEKTLGSITVGKQANIVIMSGAFDDSASKVTHVWVDGRPVLAPQVTK